MDLQLLASEIQQTPSFYTAAMSKVLAASLITEIQSEYDMDLILSVLCGPGLTQVLSPPSIEVERVIVHAGVAKPYVDFSGVEDNFL